MVVDKNNFDDVIAQSKSTPVLLDFWAAWCGPCRMIAPVLDELEKETEGKAVIGKINVDEEGELAQRFQIASIPTLLLIKDGMVAGKLVGFQNKSQIKTFLGL